MVDGVARIHLFPLYSGSAWLSKFYHDWLRFFFPPNTQDQNHLDISGIEPGSPAQQASTLSITPSPLRWVLEKNTAMVSHWVNGVWMSRPGLEPRTRNSPLYSMHYWLRYLRPLSQMKQLCIFTAAEKDFHFVRGNLLKAETFEKRDQRWKMLAPRKKSETPKMWK